MALLEIRNLSLDFRVGRDTVHALRNVDMTIKAGSRTAIVGESGSGKSVTSLAVLRLLPSTARIVSGEITFENRDLLSLGESDLGRVRGRSIAMIFQHAMASLNPLYPVGQQIADIYRHHFGGSKQAAWAKAVEVLGATGIPNPEDRARDYPYQFSGGMAQRVLIAMALVCRPRLLIADEPTSGLDVTIQSQVLNLIEQVVGELDATLVLITHDIAVVYETCDHVIVMYAGGVMESGTIEQVFGQSANPYTIELLKCFEETDAAEMPFIPGRVPDMRESWEGCSFAPRCPFAGDICRQQAPPLIELEPEHLSACHFAREVQTQEAGNPLIGNPAPAEGSEGGQRP
ncbi:MAG: ABC transporter ATP-binding protein [Chloroflexi bacterium]|nr:ABC transporter ATP-binding protein [Chloroflexota bacterium]